VIGGSRPITRLVHRAHLLYTARPMRGTSRISALRIGCRRFAISLLLLPMAFAMVVHPALAKKDIYGDEPNEFPFDENMPRNGTRAQSCSHLILTIAICFRSP